MLAQRLDNCQPSNANQSEKNQLLNLDVGQNDGEQFVGHVAQLLGLCLQSRLEKMKGKIRGVTRESSAHLALMRLFLERCNLEHAKAERKHIYRG